ncbi:FadR/GntR family transcriptional regulator [Shewanella halifaxensis]|uniref:FadR/GntR family transcriptional regulator n=1 Tax=Shewanella halifaxensis TaxID=271098 RepID=UPI000D59E482|nr:FadR/GntR family transcriptional regulator [Shewanella halifaxensis]
MTPFKPVKQIKASDEVFNQLKSAIFNGQYLSGEKLPSERELIESFHVSRTVVRESIKALEASGLVEIKQGATGGAFIKALTFERLTSATKDLFFMNQMSFSEICEARLNIEPMVARLAAKNCTEEWAARLREACLRENDSTEYPETILLKSKVHYLIAEMCDNRYLAAIVKSMVQLVGTISHEFKPDSDEIHPAGLHNMIVEAIITGDADKAEREMYLHLTNFSKVTQDIERQYRKRAHT